MKYPLLLCLCISLSVTLASQSRPESPGRRVSARWGGAPTSARVVENYGKLPLAFEANQGQTNPQVKFLSRGAGYSLFLTSTEAVLALSERSQPERAASAPKAPISDDKKTAVLRMKLVGADAKVEVIGHDELPGKSNYFIGNDPKKWHTNVRQFAKVRYGDVYPGIDLVYYGHQRELEYDFVLQPGANPEAIRLGIEGARKLRIEHGDLVLANAAGDVHLSSPHIYQEGNGIRQKIRGRYVIKNNSEVGFKVAAYDRRRALVIDPVLAYSTYLEGKRSDVGFGIAVDSLGNAYVTGATESVDFPTKNAIQPSSGGARDAFVTKISADGNTLLYSTYLGGHDWDAGNGIAVDSTGNVYVTGYTFSNDFPEVNAIQTFGGSLDAFVTKINAAGSALVYSTYLGGGNEDSGTSIALDPMDNVFVTGATDSPDFPTKNAIQSSCGCAIYVYDAFVTKINAAGSVLLYSTYLGGSGGEGSGGIAVDSAGNAYVTGWTGSTDFPIKNAFQPTLDGPIDVFITKINPVGSAFVYSTFLGGSDIDYGAKVGLDSEGNAYVTGLTESPDFPLANAFQPYLGGGEDAFVAKIDPQGSALVYSSYLGGSGADQGLSIFVDAADNCYVTGITSGDFPTVNAVQSNSAGGNDAFVAKINPPGSALLYSTYLGGSGQDLGYGIAVDLAGTAYITGGTSKTFPTTPAAFQPAYKPSPNGGNGFVAKIAGQTFVSTSAATLKFPVTLLGNTSSAKQVTVTNQGSSALPINQIFVGGLDTADFAVTNSTCASSLGAGASCTVTLTFTPMAKKLRRAGLGISTPDPGSPNAVALNGTGTVVSLSKKTVGFGDQQTGTSSPPQNVTLTNVGGTQLNFNGISVTGKNAGDFSQTNTCGTSIGAHASCTITVTFTPTATGTRKATVTISDNGGGSPQTVTLTGSGT